MILAFHNSRFIFAETKFFIRQPGNAPELRTPVSMKNSQLEMLCQTIHFLIPAVVLPK